MALSTYQTYLMHKGASESAYSKLIDIKSFSDLGGTPEQLDTTTLSDPSRTGINGIQELESLTFDANYTAATFGDLKELEGKDEDYAIWFGASASSGGGEAPSGVNGKFSFRGQLSVYVTGGGVNEVVGMTITIAPSTPIAFSES